MDPDQIAARSLEQCADVSYRVFDDEDHGLTSHIKPAVPSGLLIEHLL